MPRACSICTHPKREHIEAAMPNGAIPRTLPARFGVTKAELSRHLQHAPARQPVEPSEPLAHDANPRPVVSHPSSPLIELLSGIPSAHGLMTLDGMGVSDPDRLGEGDLQRQIVRQFRNAWKLLDQRHRTQELEWLQGQLQENVDEF